MLTSRTLPPSLKAIPSNVASERPRKPWSPSRVVPDPPPPILPPALQARYVLPSGYVAGDRRDASPSPTRELYPRHLCRVLCRVLILRARQIHGEGGPFVWGALHGNPAAVVLGHVPHDGEPQSRPARGLGACLVHAVEALEDARYLALRYADARVGDAYDYFRTFGAPDHLHPPALRRVLDGIVY